MCDNASSKYFWFRDVYFCIIYTIFEAIFQKTYFNISIIPFKVNIRSIKKKYKRNENMKKYEGARTFRHFSIYNRIIHKVLGDDEFIPTTAPLTFDVLITYQQSFLKKSRPF